MLVLHAPHHVRWRVRSHGVRGKLTVVLQSDHEINTQGAGSMDPLEVIREDLGDRLRKDALLDWVAEKYGPPVSYTNVPLANRFKLIVDGAAHLRDPDPVSSHGRENPGPVVDPFNHPEKTHVAIIQNKQIDCLMDDMVITLGKQVLQVYGVQRSQLTLLDPSCIASENQTHYRLSTSLADCGTYRRERNGILFYRNAILVRSQSTADVNPVMDDDYEMLGDEDDGGSGSGLMMIADDTHLDDEDYAMTYARPPPVSKKLIRVDFECEYSMQQKPETFAGSELPWLHNIHFELQMFTDSRFLLEERSFPMLVEEEQEMYIQASVHGDERLGVMVYSCWISGAIVSSWSKAQTFHKFLDHGCPHDYSFEFMKQSGRKAVSEEEELPDNISQFSLQYKFRYPDAPESSYLQCRLEPCLKRGEEEIEGADLSVCTTQEHYCVQNRIDVPSSGRLPQSPPYRQMVYLGELERRSETDNRHIGKSNGANPSPGTLGGSEKVQVGETRSCTTIVNMEGLDNGTAVGIAFAAFFIGVLLMGALCYIHTHTGPMHTCICGHRNMRSNETSGESTPSSTAPITIHQVNPH